MFLRRSPARRILFFSKAPMNWVMFGRVAEQLARDERISIDVHAEDEAGRDIAELYSPLGITRDRLVGAFAARWTKYDLYLSADIRLVGRRARKKAHIFHGASFKGKAFTEKITDYDQAFLLGPYQRRQFVERGLLKPDDRRMLNIGMPKTDPLVNGQFDREEVLRDLGVQDTGKPVVLFAPTWRKESSLNTQGEEICRAVGGMKDVTLLVKIHDLSFNPRTNRRDWGAWFTEQKQVKAPWFFIDRKDITPYLAISDMLISDASSTANEFLLRDKPLVFMDVPELIEKYRESIDLDTWGRKTGVLVEKAAELPAVIEGELKNPGRLAEVRRAAAQDYFYNHGCATEASVRAIYDLLELTPP